MRTPPGISEATFTSALEAFAGVVGDQWVLTSDADMHTYRDAYTPLRNEPDERVASAAVAPQSVEEVQEIVRIANRYKIPLYAISTGRNLGYGGSAPAYSGSVVVDLKRMNQIIEVNDSNHYAIVEPGVSYFDLYNYCIENTKKVWLDVPDPGWGSVVGNALDHGVGHTTSRFRNHFDAHCGMEVVLPSGELLRTGMGAMPNSQTWAQYKSGLGPIIDGLFSQSNMGIVTKMGFWLMPEPEAYLQGTVAVRRYDDLHDLVEVLKYVENMAIAQGAPEMASPLLGAGGDTKTLVNTFLNGPPQFDKYHRDLIAGAELGYSRELEQYGLDNNIPYWTFHVSFYGPRKVVEAQWEAVQDIMAERVGDAIFNAHDVVTDRHSVNSSEIYAQNLGIPNLEFFAMGTRTGGQPPSRGHLFFSPVIPQTAEGILEANRVFSQAVREIPLLQQVPMFNLLPFSLPTAFYERSFMMVIGFPVLDNQEINKSSVAAFRELINIAAAQGWGEYRTSPVFQDQVMQAYSFNDNALLRFHETIKDALDPNGIISPGRYGIWPRNLRGRSS